MMTIGGTAHISMLVATILIIALLMFIASKVSRFWQDVMIYSATAICMIGILFLHLTHYGKELDFKNFFIQMFQVCNFNFILLPLSLIKKNELARQYLFMFSMFCAASTFVAYPSDVENSMWYSIVTLNFWIDHMMIVLVPMLMIATRRFKPQFKYVIWVGICVLLYFFSAFLLNWGLNGWTFDGGSNYSYTMSPDSIMILQPFFKWIPIPYVYLLPVWVVFVAFFYFLAFCFKNYKVEHY